MDPSFKDIYFNLTNGTALDFVFTKIIPNTAAYVYVEIPTVVENQDFNVSIYWAGSSVWANKTGSSVFDSNFITAVPFSEMTGTTAYDLRGKNNVTLVGSPTWNDLGIGDGGVFLANNGTTLQWGYMTDQPEFDMTEWTIEFFGRPLHTTTTYNTFLSRVDYGGSGEEVVWWNRISGAASPYDKHVFGFHDGVTYRVFTGTKAVKSTTFSYLGYVYSDTGDYWNSWVNDSKETASCTYTTRHNSDKRILVGRESYDDSPERNFTGWVDEVRISNIARSDAWSNFTRKLWVNYVDSVTFTSSGGSVVYSTNYTIFAPTITMVNGLYSASIYDESTNSLWGMASTQNETLTFTCVASQSIQNITASSGNNYILYDTPRVVKLDVNFTATGDGYYRKQVPTCTFPCIENVDFYLANLNTSTLVELTLTMQDWTGLFGGAEVRFKRPILTSGIIQITSDLFDAEKKAILYLIKDMEYQIEVYKDGVTKSIGYLIIDSDTAKTITVADIAFSPDGVYAYEDIKYGASINADYLTAFYNDTSGTTTSVTWNVYNATSGSLLYTTSSVCNLCSFSWNHSGSYTAPFISNLVAVNPWLGVINTTRHINYYNTTAFVGSGTFSRNTFKWFAVIFLVGVSLMVGRLSLSMGSVLFAVLTLIFSMFGWLQLHPIVTGIAVLFSLGIAMISRGGES